MTTSSGQDGFQYVIEIKDEFGAALEGFRLGLKAAKEGAQEVSSQLKELANAAKEAKRATKEAKDAAKEAALSQEGLAASIGNASRAQRAKMTDDQRVADSLEKRAQRFKHNADVEAAAEAKGIVLRKRKKDGLTEEERAVHELERATSKQRVAGLKSDMIEEGNLSTLKKKIVLTEQEIGQQAELRAQRIRTQAQLRAATNEILGIGGPVQGPPVDRDQIAQNLAPQGPEPTNIQREVNAIIDRQNSLLERNAALRARNLDPRGNAILTQEKQLEKTVNEIIERQNEIRLRNLALKDRGYNPKGIALLSKQEKFEKRLNDILERRGQIERVNAALKNQGLDTQGRAFISPQEQAARNTAQELRRLEIKKFAKEAEKATPRIRELRNELGETKSVGNRVSFTFRRLFGIFAAFTAVRLFIGGLKNMVVEAVKFNATIETSTLGIASLILATGKLTTATGRVASETEGWALAQAEARRQLKLLRKDALTTAATFPELAVAFQTAIGPGLTAGLKVDQIREFASTISKAASALGVEQNQLPEEIRSLLQGTISKRNTRIATALGISNEDISRAKELGVLFEFLDQRFTAFNIASEEGAKTFNVLLSNAKDAIGNLLGVSFEGFTDKLKGLFSLINNSIVIGNDATINPALVATFSVLGKVLEEGVDQARAIITSLSAQDAAGVFESISTLLRGMIVLASTLVQGILKGFGFLANALSPINSIIQAIASTFGPAINQAVVWSITLGVVWKVLAISAGMFHKKILLSGAATTALTVKSIALAAASTRIGAAFLASISGVLAFVGGLSAAFISAFAIVLLGAVALKQTIGGLSDDLEKATGKSASFAAAIKTIGFFFLELRKAFNETLADSLSQVFLVLTKKLAQFVAFTARSLATLLNSVPSDIPVISRGAEDAAKSLQEVAAAMDAVASSHEALANRGGGYFERLQQRLFDVRTATLNYSEALSDEGNGIKKRSTSDVIGEIPGLVGNRGEEFDNLVEGAKRLKDEIAGANDELVSTLATLRTTGAVQQQVKLITEAQTRLQKEGKSIDAQKIAAQADLLRAQKDRLAVEKKIENSSENQKTKIQEALAAIREVSNANSDVAQATQNQGIVKAAVEKGTASLGDLRVADSTVEEAKAAQLTVKAKADQIASSTQAFKIATDILDVSRREENAQKRITEALSNRNNLTRQLFNLYGSKIAVIGAAESEQSQIRIKELKAQFAEAQRLLGVAGSRVNEDSQQAQATNEANAAERALIALREQNKAQQDGLSFVISKAKDRLTSVGLQGQLNLLIKEGASAEALAESQRAIAFAKSSKLVDDITEARRNSLAALDSENADLKTQVDIEGAILTAKQNGSRLDEQLADSNAQIAALQAKGKLLAFEITEKEKSLHLDFASTSDHGARAHIKGQLAALEGKTLSNLVLQAIAIAKIKEDQKVLVQQEKDRNRELALTTAIKRAKFDADQGTDRQASALVGATGAWLAAKATLTTMLNTHKESTEAIQAQQEEVRQLGIELSNLREQAASPVSEGFLSGIKEFVREVPTAFETAANFTKTAFQGLSSTLADSFTAAFDPRNTTTVAERFGELLLGLGNMLIKHVIDNLIAGFVSQLFPKLAAEAAAAAAASSATEVVGDAASAGVDAVGGAAAAAAKQAPIDAAGISAAAAITTAGGGVASALGSTAGAIATATIPLTAGVQGITAVFVSNIVPLSAAMQAMTSAFVEAAIKLSVSSKITVKAQGGYIYGYAGGGSAPQYRQGGKGSGGSYKDPRDKIQALLREGEYVLQPDAVSTLGVRFLDNLNSISGPADLPSIAGLGRVQTSAPTGLRDRRAPASNGSSSKQKVEVSARAYMVADEQTMESLLAQGDGAMQRYLRERGYKPQWQS